MQSSDIFTLGLDLRPPWELMGQRLGLDKNPHEIHLRIDAERGSS